jgi:hypothetical protein
LLGAAADLLERGGKGKPTVELDHSPTLVGYMADRAG